MTETKTVKAEITCCKCGQTYSYDDDGKTFACMPDGIMVSREWVCSDCMVDEEGETLPEYR